MTAAFDPQDANPLTPATWWLLALLAIVAPTLIAAHDSPSVTFYNQILAVFGWGLFLAALGWQPQAKLAGGAPRLAVRAIGAVFLIYALCAYGSAFWWGSLPGGLGLMGGGLSLAALAVLLGGWRAGQGPQRELALDVFLGALTLAGVLGMGLAVVQVFAPALADGIWIAEPAMAGRAVGNLRQPNHFSTLLVWACCGAAGLGARKRLPAWLASALVLAFIWGVVLTASRTGMVGMVFFTIWGLLDKRLPRLLRITLIAAPLAYWLSWWGMSLLAHADKSVAFAAEARLHDKSDISSSRFKIWANVLELIRMHPLTGVGFGEFNVAWTLTPFPTRPIAFFDHTHNVVLQWAVELGLPLALLLSALSLLALWLLAVGGRRDGEAMAASPLASPVNACAVIVAMAALHSLLEYPLWYSYFLLPAAFAWGLGLGLRAAPDLADSPSQGSAPAVSSQSGTSLVAAGLVVACGAVWCATDYSAASNIYAPRTGAGPLDKRIAFGKTRPWWGYQADYAEVTLPDDDEPSRPPADFKRTLHNLLDARLMSAYARSLAEHGEVDKARYVVARLKEFHNPAEVALMAPCKAPLEPGEEKPFQCEPPQRAYTWREILPQ